MTVEQVFIPPVIWAQRNTVLYVTICVEYIHSGRTNIDIKPEQIVFRCFAGLKEEKEYAITIQLFGTIVPEICETKVGRYVELTLQKSPDDTSYWSRLTKEKQKYHWLKVNFEKWEDENNSDDEDNSFDEDNSVDEGDSDDENKLNGENILDNEAVNEGSISMIGDTLMDDVLRSKIKGKPNMLSKIEGDTNSENIDDTLYDMKYGTGEPGGSTFDSLIEDFNDPSDELVVIESETTGKEEDLSNIDEVKSATIA